MQRRCKTEKIQQIKGWRERANKKTKQETGKAIKNDNARNIKPVQIKTNVIKWKQIKKIMQMIQKSRKI